MTHVISPFPSNVVLWFYFIRPFKTLVFCRSYDAILTANFVFDATSPTLRTSLFFWKTQKSSMAHVQRIVRYYLPDVFHLRSSTQALLSDTANLTTDRDKGPTSDGSLTANGSEPVLSRDGARLQSASRIVMVIRMLISPSLPELHRLTTPAPISSRINLAPRMVKALLLRTKRISMQQKLRLR